MIITYLSALLKALYSLVVPVHCVSCSLEGEILCVGCIRTLRDESISITRQEMFQVAAALAFSPAVSQIVLGAKDDANLQLEEVLVEAIVRARASFPAGLILVPIPSSARARRKRGRDFTLEIARSVSKQSGDQVLSLLSCHRAVAPQKSLNAQQRLLNMKNAFIVRDEQVKKFQREIGQQNFLLIDDVLTTGATMREGYRALQAVGARCLGGVSAAYSLNWSMSRSAH